MKALNKFQNTDKLKVLHELFPEEIPLVLDHIQQVCMDFQDNKQTYAKNWNDGFMPFDYWFNLSEQTAELIKKYRFNMVRSSRVFSDQLSYSHAVLFVNDRIVKYAENVCTNNKFKLAVALLFNP